MQNILKMKMKSNMKSNMNKNINKKRKLSLNELIDDIENDIKDTNDDIKDTNDDKKVTDDTSCEDKQHSPSSSSPSEQQQQRQQEYKEDKEDLLEKHKEQDDKNENQEDKEDSPSEYKEETFDYKYVTLFKTETDLDTEVYPQCYEYKVLTFRNKCDKKPQDTLTLKIQETSELLKLKLTKDNTEEWRLKLEEFINKYFL